MVLAKTWYLAKISYEHLAFNDFNINTSVFELLENEFLITVSDCTLFRMTDAWRSERIAKYQERIDDEQEDSPLITRTHKLIMKARFIDNYVIIKFDNKSQCLSACKNGFTMNGEKYVYFMATQSDLKEKSLMFIKEHLFDEVSKKIENGRYLNKELVPAKYGAYEALVRSSSREVSDPRIIVVQDGFVEFTEDVITLDDSCGEEPKMEYVKDYPIRKNINDGYGLMLPSRAEKWSEELGLDYTASGFVVRPYAFCKGLLVAFDFHEFSDLIAKNEYIFDAWGNQKNIKDADVIITTSMLKLWDSYSSWGDYITKSKDNGYSFGITKATPETLENEHSLNYQFLQSYDFTDDEIEELIAPTLNEDLDILIADPAKSILFLRGNNINEKNANASHDAVALALQIEPEMIYDKYVQEYIKKRLNKQMELAKIGNIKVHGNYQLSCGDPYALCEHIHRMPINGLLGKGEFYSSYWVGYDKLACFRAPMTCHNNIRKINIAYNKEIGYWYRYINNMLIFNTWDTSTEAFNGEDFDGDSNLTTDNEILLSKHRDLPAIICQQKTAKKLKVNHVRLRNSNIRNLGDNIGKVTNDITNQFDLMAGFPPDSKERKELEYRIMCGQLFQQNSIDKSKGIQTKKRPKAWYNGRGESEDVKKYVAYKSPYFMRYLYPQKRKTMREYEDTMDTYSRINFGKSLKDLLNTNKREEEEELFIEEYFSQSPLSDKGGTINRICHAVEKVFREYKNIYNIPFNYQIMKSENGYLDNEKIETIKTKLIKTIKSYQDEKQKSIARDACKRKLNNKRTVVDSKRYFSDKMFKQKCREICPDKEMLCNIMIDICQERAKYKSAVWIVCENEILQNLAKRNGYKMIYPQKDTNGDIVYKGENYTLYEIEV